MTDQLATSSQTVSSARDNSTYLDDLVDLFDQRAADLLALLAESINEKDVASIRIHSKRLKDGARSLGSMLLAQKCKEIEDLLEFSPPEFERAGALLDSAKAIYEKTLLEKTVLEKTSAEI